MPEQDNAQPEFPEAPALTSPRSEMVVDGTDVTFVWEPVAGATEYYIEVGPDASFDTLVIDQSVGDATSLEAAENFPTDGQTYFWRVMAKNEQGWSHGDRVESFVSATPEFAREQGTHPSSRRREEEDMGPAAELVRSAGTAAAAEVTGSEALLEQEREMGVAHEGVEAGQILAIAATVLIAVVIATLVVFFWSGNVAVEQRQAAAELSGYPELRETEIEAARLLDQYEVVSEQEGTYRIPIERAMGIMAEKSLEARNEGEYADELTTVSERARVSEMQMRNQTPPLGSASQ